jgi:hypothetical protein
LLQTKEVKVGTRADFYVGSGASAEWLGSIAWDGYEWAKKRGCQLRKARTEAAYRKAVEAILRDRNDATRPADGWPWPWNDSNTTDYAYYWDGKKTRWSCSGMTWPDMSNRQNVTLGRRSGLVIFSPRNQGGRHEDE